ncbi:unnamed protein product, partial [marine sediment metagenome]
PKILSPIELQNIEESINNLKKTFSAFDYEKTEKNILITLLLSLKTPLNSDR